MRNILLFITLLTTVALVGCGGSKLATIKVSGTVTLDGAPLADASVNFVPKTEGQGHAAYGKTDAEGRYQLQTLQGDPDAGTTPGEYLVTISKREAVVSDESGRSPPPVKSLIPTRYNKPETSELTATVAKGSTVFDFPLVSK